MKGEPVTDRECYVGIKACGCMVAAVVDDPAYVKLTAESVASFIAEGLRIERRASEDVRRELKMCCCGQTP